MNSDESYKEYDVCVITAANDYQALGYQKQIQWRKDKGNLPEQTEFVVFADPQGKRIGSGGSTIYVLYKLLKHFCKDEEYRSSEEPFKEKRILILHSGGDSRRLPAYSAVGKIFIPLPTSFSTDGFVTLFDLLLNNLMKLLCLSDGQVIVASGDVLLSFDASKVAFSDSGLTGLAYPGPVEVASNHGVYIVPQTQSGKNLRKVVDFLQKPTYDELKKCNGLDTANRAFIDTGVMNFSLDAIEVLMRASGVSLKDGKIAVAKDSLCENLINANVQLDIYKEIPFAMLGKTTKLSVVASSIPPPSFTNALQEIPFSVYLLPYCEFFHIGTSKQLIQNFHTINYTASTYRFQNFSKSKALNKSRLGNAFVYNSLINTASIKVSGSSLIEGCYLEGEILLEGENILTGIPKGAGDIRLQKEICVACMPVYNPLNPFKESVDSKSVDNGWVSIIYGIEDDFKKLAEDDAAPRTSEGARKTKSIGLCGSKVGVANRKPKVSFSRSSRESVSQSRSNGGHPETDGASVNEVNSSRVNEASTFLNNTFLGWMKDKGISPTDLWEDNQPHELWTARLFPFSTNPAESMRISLSLQVEQDASLLEVEQTSSLLCPNAQVSQLDEWRESPRMSLRQILESVDYERFLDNYSTLCQKLNLESLATILTPKSNLSSEEILSWCVEADDYNTAIKMTLALIEQSEDILFQARLYKLLSNICAKKLVEREAASPRRDARKD